MEPQANLSYTPEMQKALSQFPQSAAPTGASDQPQQGPAYTPAMQKVLGTQTPQDVQTADSQQGSQDLNGFCETAVEQWAGLPKMGATATDAWNNFVSQKKASAGIQGAQPGDLLYFGANDGNSNEGHAALFEGYDSKGNPMMISATNNGVQRSDVNHWSQNVAPLLGYVHP